MKNSRILPGLIVATLLLPGVLIADTIQLLDGKKVVGRIVKETDTELFVDLGYTIISVPRAAVVERTTDPATEPATVGAATSGDGGDEIFRVGRLEPITVQEAVQKFGEGVVRVRCPGGSGSGFVTDKRGYVVTNFHVVEGERDVEVTLYIDGENGLTKKRIKNVEIVALNEFMDLALIKIPEAEKYDLKPITLADPKSIAVGEKVFAIGAPLGLERTVNEGIVSDPSRSFQGQCYVQIDVAINPGNSGGPLFNTRGEVVGVTNMGFRGTEGLNFAIPAQHVIYFLEHRSSFLFDESRPNTGVHYFQPPRKNRGVL